MNCLPLNQSLETWLQVEAAFADRETVVLQQGWKETPDAGFLPARVQVGYTSDVLLVYAVLEDVDIYNSVSQDHVKFYEHGDVFEIFLRPEEQDSYREFHVNPNNARLQLNIPSAAAFVENRDLGRGLPDAWFLREGSIESRVLCQPDKKQWSVLSKIPFGLVHDTGRPKPGDLWLYSFSRYDYTRGVDAPVLSSTSPHTKINFHSQREWRNLVFVE